MTATSKRLSPGPRQALGFCALCGTVCRSKNLLLLLTQQLAAAKPGSRQGAKQNQYLMNLVAAALVALFGAVAARVAAAGPEAPVQLAAPVQGERYGEYKCATSQCGVPQEFILNNASMTRILEARASHPRRRHRGDRTVIFTTLRFGDESDTRAAHTDDVLGMLSNFCYWLEKVGRLEHTMLITTDERTWAKLHERGLPAFLDRAFPRRSSYAEHILPPDTWNREFDVQKHWWGWRLSSLGFRALYMDSDAVVLRDPLPLLDEPYDVQGLSDWVEPEIDRGTLLNLVCPGHRESLYAMVEEPRVPQGSMLREEFNLAPAVPRLHVPTPCQSTGIWFLQPTNATVAFMRALVDRISYQAVYEWDQTAWNELLIPFLIGVGDHPPLRYRLLPHAQFSNIGVYRDRKAKGLPVDQVVLHMGFIPGWDKIRLYTEEQLFHPEFHHHPRPQASLADARVALADGLRGSGAWAAMVGVPLAAALGVYVGRRTKRRRT